MDRPGSNAQGCGPSIYGYAADDFGSPGDPLILSDGAAVGIDCYAGPLAPGIFGYTGPARPTHGLADFNGLDQSGAWTLRVSDHLFYNFGTLKELSLFITTRAVGDCNENLIPDDCDISGGTSIDGNGNGLPDECEIRSSAGWIVQAESRKTCDVPLLPGVNSESRRGGVTQLRIAFDEPPVDVGPTAAAIEQRTCAAPEYTPYTGAAAASARVVDHELVLSFAPGLENGRTYRINLDPAVSSVEGQFVELRVLYGDVNGDGRVNGLDRSAVVEAWQGPGFSCATDVNNDGFTTATDRSLVVSAWTGSERCAP